MFIKTDYGEYKIKGIYKHYKEPTRYYQIQSIGKLHDSSNIFLIVYNQCDENGVYISIRENAGQENEKITHQPFVTHETRWSDEVEVNGVKRKRFELIK
jgi:hypothetical protein